MKPDAVTISNRLKCIRIQSGLTQSEVAQALSIDRSTYTYYENGRVPSMDTLLELATIFGVSTSEILGDLPLTRITQVNSERPEDKLKILYLTPEERQLVMRFRLCTEESRRKTMEALIDLSIRDKDQVQKPADTDN